MPGAAASLALGVLVWFGLAFGTGTWARQWLAALVAGLAMAWWRFSTMQEVADTMGLVPMSFLRFAAISVAGMLVMATAGMGLRRLLAAALRR